MPLSNQLIYKGLLALDLGNNLGLAYGSPSTTMCGFVHTVSLSSLVRKGKAPDVTTAFHNYIDNIVTTMGIGYVAYEYAPVQVGRLAAHRYGAYQALLELITTKRNIKLIRAHVKTIKSVVTGRHDATKDQMIDAINEHYPTVGGPRVANHNAADALGVFYTVCKDPEKYGLEGEPI